MYHVILASDVLITAYTHQRSHAARIVHAVQRGLIKHCWSLQTREVVTQIVKFAVQEQYTDSGRLYPARFCFQDSIKLLQDPNLSHEMQMLVSLALHTHAPLITQSSQLSMHSEHLHVVVMSPGEFMVSLAS